MPTSPIPHLSAPARSSPGPRSEGFDHRVSNLHGALGAGNYFAASSSYSNTCAWQCGGGAAEQAQERNGPLRAAACTRAHNSRLPCLTLCCRYSQMAKHSADSLATQGNGGFRAAHGSTPLPPPSAAVGHTARPRFHSNCVAMLLVRGLMGSAHTACTSAMCWPCLPPRPPHDPVPATHPLLSLHRFPHPHQCDVTLGREGPLQPQQRRPLPGYHSTSSAGTFAVYENAQVGGLDGRGVLMAPAGSQPAKPAIVGRLAPRSMPAAPQAPAAPAPPPRRASSTRQAYPHYLIHYQ